MTYEERIDKLVERAIEKRNLSLAELIASEHLEEYYPGTLTILDGDNLNVAVVPCRGFMILTRESYNEQEHKVFAEYAIYSEHDLDHLKPLYNSMNANAVYRLVYVSDGVFENMAFAIAHAVEEIKEATD